MIDDTLLYACRPVIRELLYIKHNFANMALYSKDEIDFRLEYCCTS